MIWQLVLIPLAILGVTLLLTFKVFLPRAARGGWGVLHARFPGVPALPGATASGFETFTIGGLRLGAGVRVEVDDAHLHLRPGRMGRLAGCRDLSIPWDRVRALDPIGIGLRRGEIDGLRMIGPRWVMDLAESKRVSTPSEPSTAVGG